MTRIKFIITTLLCFSLTVTAGFSKNSEKNAASEINAPWQFAVISDTQNNDRSRDNRACINSEILILTAADIADIEPDFVLVSGDLVNGWLRNGGTAFSDQYKNWRRAMNPVFRKNIRVYAVRGNHDDGPERFALQPLPRRMRPKKKSLALLKKAFKKTVVQPYTPLNGPDKEKGLTYSFDYRNTRIIGLDQYTDGQHKINQQWLNRQVARKRKTHLFVFGHEPAFGTDYPDNLSFYKKKRDLFWNSIGHGGGKIYFCGHAHFYNRSLIEDSNGNEIWQIINGTGGGLLQDWSGSYMDSDRVMCEYHDGDHYGYILVTIDGVKATIEWRALVDVPDAEWKVLDSFSYSAGPAVTEIKSATD